MKMIFKRSVNGPTKSPNWWWDCALNNLPYEALWDIEFPENWRRYMRAVLE